MSEHNKWFIYFLGGSFVVASLMIVLYRAIKTTSDIFAFFFLSALIIMFFTVFLLESMLLEPVIDRIAEAAEESRFFYNLLFFSLFVSIIVGVPKTVILSINAMVEDEPIPQNNCVKIVDQIFESPKSIYDRKLLSKCPFTQPLTKIFSSQGNAAKSQIADLLYVADQYLDLVSKNLSFAATVLLAIIGGASYLAIAALTIKKGAMLLLGLFSSTAVKILLDGIYSHKKK